MARTALGLLAGIFATGLFFVLLIQALAMVL
jgi:hypothetical protein